MYFFGKPFAKQGLGECVCKGTLDEMDPINTLLASKNPKRHGFCLGNHYLSKVWVRVCVSALLLK